jgi:hypothetical protein
MHSCSQSIGSMYTRAWWYPPCSFPLRFDVFLKHIKSQPRALSDPPTWRRTGHGLGHGAGDSHTTTGSPTKLAFSISWKACRSVRKLFPVLSRIRSAIQSFKQITPPAKYWGATAGDSPPAIAKSSTRPRRSIYVQRQHLPLPPTASHR